MEFEGIKKLHLIGSSILYFFVVIITSLMLFGNYFYYILSSVSIILLLMGILFFIYYVIKKEELMSKVLSISNIILSIIYTYINKLYAQGYYDFKIYENFYFGFLSYTEYIAVPYFATLIVSLIFLLFNLYLFWSREMH